jgi:hypothetical protein
MRTIRINTIALVIVSKKIELEVKAEKTKYMLMSRDQNAGQNSNILIGSKFFGNVKQFKYLGTTIPNENSSHKEIKNRLKSENVRYHSMQNPLPSSLLIRNVKIKMYRTITLTFVLCTCETWLVTLREGRRLRVLENRVLRRICGPKRD